MGERRFRWTHFLPQKTCKGRSFYFPRPLVSVHGDPTLIFRRHSKHEKDMNKIILSIKSPLKRGLIFQMECKVKLKACQKLHEQKIEVSNLSDRIEMNLWFLDEVISYDSYAYPFQHYWRGSRLKAKTRLQSLGKIRHKQRRLQPTVNGLLMRMTDMLII